MENACAALRAVRAFSRQYKEKEPTHVPDHFRFHAHYDDDAFDEDRDALLSSLPELGVCGIVNAASDLESSRKGSPWRNVTRILVGGLRASTHRKPDALLMSRGSLPTRRWKSCGELTSHPRIVAIGEIGLDYHYETPSRDCQRQWLACQLRLAVEQRLPVILHDRNAHEDTLKLLRQYRPQGVVHCFSGSVEMARELVRLGFYIGLGGAVTFQNARRAPLWLLPFPRTDCCWKPTLRI